MKKRMIAALTAAALIATYLPTIAYATDPQPPSLTIGESTPQPAKVSMAMPDAISGTVDPFNIGGKGQIAFEEIELENTGEVPTQVTVNAFEFISDTVECINEPITEQTQGKKVYLWLVDKNGTRYELPRDNVVDLGTVEPGEKLVLKLDGQANQYFYEWMDSDAIRFRFSFSFKADTTAIQYSAPPAEIIPDPEVPPADVIPDDKPDPEVPPADVIPDGKPDTDTPPLIIGESENRGLDKEPLPAA